MWQIHQNPRVESFQIQLDPFVFQRVVAVFIHPLGSRVQILEPVRVRFVFGMFEHSVPSYVGWISRYVQLLGPESETNKNVKT